MSAFVTGNYSPHWSDGGVWDICVLDDVALPGLASIDIETKNHYKIGVAQGLDLPPVTYKGRLPRSLTMKLKLVSDTDWDAWQDTVRDLHLDAPGKVVTPHRISHPQASGAGITQIVIEEIKISQPTAKEPMIVNIKMIETGPTKEALTGVVPGPAGTRPIFDPVNGPETDLQARQRQASRIDYEQRQADAKAAAKLKK